MEKRGQKSDVHFHSWMQRKDVGRRVLFKTVCKDITRQQLWGFVIPYVTKLKEHERSLTTFSWLFCHRTRTLVLSRLCWHSVWHSIENIRANFMPTQLRSSLKNSKDLNKKWKIFLFSLIGESWITTVNDETNRSEYLDLVLLASFVVRLEICTGLCQIIVSNWTSRVCSLIYLNSHYQISFLQKLNVCHDLWPWSSWKIVEIMIIRLWTLSFRQINS